MEASNFGTKEGLLDNNTEINKRKLLDAVITANVKTAKQLIGEGININFILNGWSPLHAALRLRSMDMLELLLSQPNINLNISNEGLAAPLLWSIESYSFLKYGLKEKYVLRLIRAGCDISLRDEDETTLLHLSILKLPTTSVTYELLKQGADVNAFCSRYGTALHLAVRKENLELVCMLLYYNADVCIKWDGQTPFRYALHIGCSEIVKVLNKYRFIDDDINYIINSSTEECIRFLRYSNADIFKAVWPRFDSEIIISMNPTFIHLYFTYSMYALDWAECTYLILNSDIAFDLIERYELNTGRDSFLQRLLGEIRRRPFVTSEDWLGLIYMVLTLGFEVKINDINCAVALYGLNQDLELLIYSTHISVTDDSIFVCPLHAFVIGMETNYSVIKIFQLFHNAIRAWKQSMFPVKYSYYYSTPTFAKAVAFFSFPADVKNRIVSLFEDKSTVRERLQEIPEFPSLVELSRNQTHKYLVQKFRFKQAYQLQDCVKKLLIPNKIKNIILFKEPIY